MADHHLSRSRLIAPMDGIFKAGKALINETTRAARSCSGRLKPD